mmetsp:Transcript_28536/g.51642  ORF Transcript_28536/g.51642 Transcript_28536/m.51642 type:complete len:447 (-) Transcript_28536:105-1445(-)
MSAALAHAARPPQGTSQAGFIPRIRPVSPVREAGPAGQPESGGHTLKQFVIAGSSAASGSGDGSTSAGSTEGSLEDTMNSTASKEYSFGTTHNAALAANAASVPTVAKTSTEGQDAHPSSPAAPATERSPEKRSQGSSPASPNFAASSPSAPSPRSSAKRSAKPPADEDDDDSGNEFTFGTSQPIQLPDFSQMPKSASHLEGSLRQAGNSPGEEGRELALLSTVQEGNEVKPPLPVSPPPSSVRAPPPPVGAHPLPYVSPRLPHPSAMQAQQMQAQHMQAQQMHLQQMQAQQMQAQHMQAQQMQAQMYASNPAAMALYDPSHAAAAQAAAFDQLAYAQAHAEHQATVSQESSHGYYDPEMGQGHGEACKDDDAYGPYFDGKQGESEEHPEPPLAFRLAFMLEAFCAEAGNCKREQVKRWMAGTFMLLILVGAFILVAVLLNAREDP